MGQRCLDSLPGQDLSPALGHSAILGNQEPQVRLCLGHWAERSAYDLCPDKNGVPGPTLATQQVIQNQFTQNGQGNFPLVCFAPVLLTAGLYYHVVVRNIDPNPKENWSSLDFMYSATVLNQTPDVQVLVSAQGVPWEPVDGGEIAGSPVALFYADGSTQGYPWYQIGTNGVLLAGTAYGFVGT